MVKKKIVLDELENAPRVKLEDEVVVDEPKDVGELKESDSAKEAVIPQQPTITPFEPAIDEDDTDEEKESEVERRLEEKEDIEDGITPEPVSSTVTSFYPSNPARVRDVDSEFEKFTLLVQGSDTSDGFIGGTLPFDLALTKIETPEDRALLRLDAECLIESANTFGRDSVLASEFKELLKGDIMLSRGAQGFLSKLLVTNITQSFVDKNVRQDKREGIAKGIDKTGFMMSPNQPTYQQNY